MKILLYAEPTIFAEATMNIPSLQLTRDYLWNMCGKSLSMNENVELKFVISEETYYQNIITPVKGFLDDKNYIILRGEELISIFEEGTSLLKIRQKIFLNRLSKEEEEKYKEYLYNKIMPFNPDVIILFPTHNKYINKLFPNAMVVNNENGMFSSRKPFMRTLRYEPFEYINNFTNVFANEINRFPITQDMSDKVDKFRKEIIDIIDSNNPYKNKLIELKKQYKYLVLLPIITDNIYKESFQDDEYTYVLNVLKRLPKDIGVIVTKHDFTNGMINERVIKFLQQKYANLISFDCHKFVSFGAPSLHFYKYVDAVINCMTGTGLLGTLWDTRIIANDKLYSHWFSDFVGLDNIENKLSSPIKNKNNMLYWYLTHFIVFEKHFNEPNWYYNYFKNKLEKFRKDGITFELFEQIEDFDDISQYIINYVKNQYQQKQPKKITFLQKIFSVINEGKHKVLRIFGLKFKFRQKIG